MKKRFQYRGRNGIEWTEWFECNKDCGSIQLKTNKNNILRNEYQ